MEINEPEIIRQCQEGDYSRFGELYEIYVRKIYNFLYYRTHHKETAEDLTSVVFSKGLEHIGQFNPGKAKYSTWLYQIARNTLIDHFRTYKAMDDIEAAYDVAQKGNIEVDVDVRMNLEKVQAYLKTLPKEAREVVVMRVWDGLSYKEISEILGKSEAAAKMLFARTIEKLNKEVAFALMYLLLIK